MPRKNLCLVSLPLLVVVPSFLGATAAFGLSPKQQQHPLSILVFDSTSSNPVLLTESDEPSRSNDREHCRKEREIYQDIDRDRQNLQNDEDESDRRHDQQELRRDNRRLQDPRSEGSERSYNCDYLYREDNREYNRDGDYNREDNYNRDLPPVVVPVVPQSDSPAYPYREDNREYNRDRNYNREDNYNRDLPPVVVPVVPQSESPNSRDYLKTQY